MRCGAPRYVLAKPVFGFMLMVRQQLCFACCTGCALVFEAALTHAVRLVQGMQRMLWNHCSHVRERPQDAFEIYWWCITLCILLILRFPLPRRRTLHCNELEDAAAVQGPDFSTSPSGSYRLIMPVFQWRSVVCARHTTCCVNGLMRLSMNQETLAIMCAICCPSCLFTD